MHLVEIAATLQVPPARVSIGKHRKKGSHFQIIFLIIKFNNGNLYLKIINFYKEKESIFKLFGL
jgi:hypothetical protein